MQRPKWLLARKRLLAEPLPLFWTLSKCPLQRRGGPGAGEKAAAMEQRHTVDGDLIGGSKGGGRDGPDRTAARFHGLQKNLRTK